MSTPRRCRSQGNYDHAVWCRFLALRGLLDDNHSECLRALDAGRESR